VAEGGALVTSARPDPPGHAPRSPAGPAPDAGRAAYLAGSDERSLTGEYLAAVVRALPRRRVLVDVGPGDPALTARLGRHFERVLVVEPDPAGRAAVLRACPWAVPSGPDPGDGAADLVLCAQGARSLRALSAGPPERRRAAVLRMLRWAVPGGEMVVLLPNPASDRARLLHRLTGVRPDLAPLRDGLLRDAADRARGGAEPVGRVWLETLECRFRTRRFGDAVAAAGFLLDEAGFVPDADGSGDRFPLDAAGAVPGGPGFPPDAGGFGARLSPDPTGFAPGAAAPPGAARPPRPSPQALADLLRREFTRPDGTVSLGCALDVLRVRRAGRPRTH
jgi:hypothetical protein